MGTGIGFSGWVWPARPVEQRCTHCSCVQGLGVFGKWPVEPVTDERGGGGREVIHGVPPGVAL